MAKLGEVECGNVQKLIRIANIGQNALKTSHSLLTFIMCIWPKQANKNLSVIIVETLLFFLGDNIIGK
jgi:hypothetical protein